MYSMHMEFGIRYALGWWFGHNIAAFLYDRIVDDIVKGCIFGSIFIFIGSFLLLMHHSMSKLMVSNDKSISKLNS